MVDIQPTDVEVEEKESRKPDDTLTIEEWGRLKMMFVYAGYPLEIEAINKRIRSMYVANSKR